MLFPDRRRVLYGDNPLVDVICRISFSRILAIDSDLPVDFQSALVGDYPLLDTTSFRRAPTDAEPEPGRGLIYEFQSANKEVTIALSPDFLAIRASKYQRWEAFREHIVTALRTLLQVYKISLFTRVSLNYVNVIDKDALGLKDAHWAELIRASLIGPFAEGEVDDDKVEEAYARWSMRLDKGFLEVITGLVIKPETDNVCFLIDNTFSREESLEADEHKSLAVLDGFNVESGRVFRWCIEDRLHEILRPTALG